MTMMHKSVLLDTSFLLRFLNERDPLFANADKFFRYFIQYDIKMMVSTISIAEYCVGGDIEELPLRNIQILPFNVIHAKRTGEFAKVVFEKKLKLHLPDRKIIPNDTKLFAQADCEKSIDFYLSSDSRSKKIYYLLKETMELKFDF